MKPFLTIDEASTLASETDYATMATHQDINPINKADAAAFFAEGYLYAIKEMKKEVLDKLDIWSHK